MSETQVAAQKLKLPHSRKAEQQGVSTKTLDRWVELGIMPEPERIRGRKYHDANAKPCADKQKIKDSE
jgi:hypothetical protein